MTQPSSEYGKRSSATAICSQFNTEIAGRNIIITGPSLLGIGYDTALAIAKQRPALLILAGRSISKLQESEAEILKVVPEAKLRLLELDLSNMDAVRKSAKEVNAYEDDIDVLINNAGTMDNPYTVTAEGHEIQFASNYLGHWLFTNSILPKILAGRNKRVVNVASMGHAGGDIRYDDPAFKQGPYDKKAAYGQSKTGNMLFTLELARRYGDQGLYSFSLCPGGIHTPLQKHWSVEEKQEIGRLYGAYNDDGSYKPESEVWKTPDQGASTSVRAAFDPSLNDHNGSYLSDCNIANDAAKPYAKDAENAKRLWDFTNQLLGEKF